MRVVFFGSGAFGLPTLGELSRHHDLLAIVTQPDKPAGRGARLTPTPVGAWAGEHAPDAEVLKPDDVNEPPARDRIRSLPADAWVVIAFGQKLSGELLRDRFAVNLHASLLPRWRGASPVQSAILGEDPLTGNSVITLADRMDAGLVLAQSRREIAETMTAGELHDALSLDGAALVEDVLRAHAQERLEGRRQDEGLVTRARKLSKNDAWIDWASPSARCRCRINALSPWPGVEVTLGGQALKLLRAGPGGQAGAGSPGELVDVRQGLIACGDGRSVRLLEVQAPGKRAMAWDDFARGRALERGMLLEGGRRA